MQPGLIRSLVVAEFLGDVRKRDRDLLAVPTGVLGAVVAALGPYGSSR